MGKRKKKPIFSGSLLLVHKPLILTIAFFVSLGISTLSACESAYRFDGDGDDQDPMQEIFDEEFATRIDPEGIPPREPSDCPGLDSQLLQIIQSENPRLSASQIGMNVKEDKVQVLFVLETEETDFLSDYDIELGTQVAHQIQAYVPFNRLCELASLDAVLAIRPVDRIFPY